MTLLRTPAALGGEPAFPDGVPFVRPARPPLADVMTRLAPSYEQGALTNGPLVRQLEERCASRLGVSHVVAVSSCTAGLMLAVRALGTTGAAVLPSFTFSASAHALAWNGLTPVFSECDAATMQIDVGDAAHRLDGAGLIMATHVFGAPCRAEQVVELGRSAGVPVIFDAAHGFGSLRQGTPLGNFGAAEVFSLSPTKPMVAGEGGLVATNDDAVAEFVRLGRDYGNPGDYDTRFVGLNARMSELHAALALESFEQLDGNLDRRRAVAGRYLAGLSAVPGIACQDVDPGDVSTYKDFTIAVNAPAYGLTRDALAAHLKAEGVDTRPYFWPPVHRQQAYRPLPPTDLPITDRVASSVVSLPIYPDLDLAVVDGIAELIRFGHEHAEALCRIPPQDATSSAR